MPMPCTPRVLKTKVSFVWITLNLLGFVHMESGSLFFFILSSALLRLHYQIDVPTALSYRLQPRSKLSAECPRFPAKRALAIAKSRPSLLFRSTYVRAGFMGIGHALFDESGRAGMQIQYGYSSLREGKRNETRSVPTASMISNSWGRNTGGRGPGLDHRMGVKWLPDVFVP
ncbi:uncharacterized protein BDZ83DRAFT_383419 [Colletotrichum acutatum]|uniref:Uncharacterized protein n=1 Tax=Glomerella acutata TaxID=27357 RepID=A0AAD8UNW9_GLOAC|nr:uncharacterized protein BDZ83DRAFT_383419 [Colletotrichum acutatum]KAK1723730.1 hypothetical protein BDZ83DRAFT_383419 [Colletotrichum acutatum]